MANNECSGQRLTHDFNIEADIYSFVVRFNGLAHTVTIDVTEHTDPFEYFIGYIRQNIHPEAKRLQHNGVDIEDEADLCALDDSAILVVL